MWPLARDFATSFIPDRVCFDRTWNQLVQATGTLALVAETGDGQLIGYLLANSHLTLFANGPVAWVEELMIDAEHRRTGVGGRLLQYAERWASAEGAAYLGLASRRAGTFYSALGYENSAVFYKKALTDHPQPDSPI